MKRNYGIDLLRMVLMFMVVILHVLGDGGILDAAEPLSLHYNVAWLLETCSYCAVNGYVLITGYFYIDGKYHISSLIMLCLQTVLYTFGIMAAACVLKPELFYIEDLWDAIFPISRGTYWYLSSYVGLFVLIPFLNAGIHALSEQKMKQLLKMILLVFSVYSTFALGVLKGDPFGELEGYSLIWLIVMYLIGACIKKYDWGKSLSVGKAMLGFIGMVMISWIVKLGILNFVGDAINSNLFISYISPTIVMAAVCLFLAFQKLNIPNVFKKPIAIFSPAAFGVYLIHKQEYVAGFFIRGKFAHYLELNVFAMVGAVLLTAVVIFVVCILIDLVRCKVFKLLKIKQRLEGK